MNELVAACFLFLHSYGVEPMDSVRQPIVTFNSYADIEKIAHAPAKAACLNGHIYLSPAVDLTTIEGQSSLCHEVVHFTQGYCPYPKDRLERDFKERGAYQLQNQFLIDHGSKWRAIDPNNPYGSAEGYQRPREKLAEKGYGNEKVLEPPAEEPAEVIRRRFKVVEGAHDRHERRGFHARFEDETLDEIKIKEYNTHTR